MMKAVQNGILRSSFLSSPCNEVARVLLMMGLWGRWWGGRGLGGQQAVRAWRSLGSWLLGGRPRIGRARTAFIDLCVKLGRTLKVNTVEHLQRDHSQTLTGEITTTYNSLFQNMHSETDRTDSWKGPPTHTSTQIYFRINDCMFPIALKKKQKEAW